MDELKKDIKELISKGKTKAALQELLDFYLERNEEIYNEVVVVSGSFSQLNSQSIKGTLKHEDLSRKQNEINDSILNLVDKKIPKIVSKQVKEAKSHLLICKQHLTELIKLTKNYIKQYNVLSIVIVIVAFLIIFIPLEKIIFSAEGEAKKYIELIKLGFGLFGIVLPLWLQGLNYTRKARIVSLQTSVSLLDNASQVKEDLLVKIVDEIIKSITKNI